MHEGRGAVVDVVNNMGEGLGVWKRKVDDRAVGARGKQSWHSCIDECHRVLSGT